MATETNTLIFEIRKVGVDAANTALKQYAKNAKEASTATKALAKYVSPFDKMAREAGQFGDSMQRLISVQKASEQINKKYVDTNKASLQEFAKLNSAIVNSTDIKAKHTLRMQQGVVVGKSEKDIASQLKAKYTALNNVYKAGTMALDEHTQATVELNSKLQGTDAGAKRLIEIKKAGIVINQQLAAMQLKTATAVVILEKALVKETDALKKEELQANINILRKRQETAVLNKNVQKQKLYTDSLREIDNIRSHQNKVLAEYNRKLKAVNGSIKGATEGVGKLVQIERGKITVEKEADAVLAKYNKRLRETKEKLKGKVDAHTKEAYELQKEAILTAKANTVIAKNIALQKLASDKLKQKKFLLKEASRATLKYNDDVKALKKQITDEHNIIKKVSVARRVSNEITRLSSTLEKYYKEEIRGVELELKKNISAEERLALNMKKKTLAEAAGNAITARTNALLDVKRMKMKAMSASLLSASRGIMRFGRTMTRYFTTVLVGAIAQGVKFQANIEAQIVRFQILTQSMEKGKKLFQQIVEFSAMTPFQLPDLDEAAQVLLAFGSPLNQVMNELKMLGDVAQGDAEKLERIAMSFGKVRSRGTAHMRELNRFIMSGVPIIAELNKQLGLSGDQLFKDIASNKVSFDNVKASIESLTSEGGRFYQMTEKVAETLKGRWSTAVDNMNLNLSKLVEDITPRLKGILEQFIDWSQAFRTLDSDARRTILTIMGVTAAIGPLSVAVSALLKMGSLTVAGHPIGWIIAGITALAGLVSWGILKKQMGDVSQKSAEMADSLKTLTESSSFAGTNIPGMTREMYDFAKANDAWSLSLLVAAERVELLDRMESGSVLTRELRKAYSLMENMQNFEISASFGDHFKFGAVAYTAKDLRTYLNELSDELPEAGTIISDAILATFGTEKSIEALTKQQLGDLLNGEALGKSLSDLLGGDLDEFEATVMTSLEKRYLDTGLAKTMAGSLGISPEDILAEWGESTKKGLSTITGQAEEGLIDYEASILRTKQAMDEMPSLQDSVVAMLKSGELTPNMWATEFTGALSVDEAISQVIADTKKAMGEYSQVLIDAVSSGIYTIRNVSRYDNLISAVLGITDEKDIKKQLQSQLEGYSAMFVSFGLDTEDLIAIEAGDVIPEKYIQDLIDATRIAKQELDVILEAEEKIDLFKAFFENDIDSFIIKTQLDALEEELYNELSSMDFVNADPLSEGFADAITMGFENMNLTDAQQKLVDRLNNLYKEAEFDTDALFENIFGTTKDWDTYLDEIAYEASLQDFKTQFMKVSRMLQISPLTLMTSIKTNEGVDVESLIKNLDNANPTLTIDTEGTAEIGNTLGSFVLDAGDVIANASIEAGKLIAEALAPRVKSVDGASSSFSTVLPRIYDEQSGYGDTDNSLVKKTSLLVDLVDKDDPWSEFTGDGNSLETMLLDGVSDKEVSKAIDEAVGGVSGSLAGFVGKVTSFFSRIKTEVDAIDLTGFDAEAQLEKQGGLWAGLDAWSIGYRDKLFAKISGFFTDVETDISNMDVEWDGIPSMDEVVSRLKGLFGKIEETTTTVANIDTTELDTQVELIGTKSIGLFDAIKVAMDSAVFASDGSLSFVEDTGILFGVAGKGALELRQKTLDATTSLIQLLADTIKAVEDATGLSLGIEIPDMSGINITDIDFTAKINAVLGELNTAFNTFSVKISEMDEEKQQAAYTALAGFVDEYNAVMAQISELQGELPNIVNIPMADALPATEAVELAEIATTMEEMLSPSVNPLIIAIEANTAAILGGGTGTSGGTVPLTPEQILTQFETAEQNLIKTRVGLLGNFGEGANDWLQKLGLSTKEALTGAELLEGVYEDIGQVLAQSLTPALEQLGQSLASGNIGLGDSLSSVMSAMTDALPGLLINAGLKGLIEGGWANPVAWAMLAAGGIGAIINGFNSGESEGTVTEMDTVSGGSSRGFTPPADSRGVNIVVNNNSTSKVSTEETTNADGSRGIKFMIYDAVNEGFGLGEFDNSMNRNYGTKRQGRR